MDWESSPAEPWRQAGLAAPACVFCASRGRRTVADVAEMEARARFLSGFFRRRARAGAPPEALLDKADFTHSFPAAVVACAGCGLLYRCPRPHPDAILRRYVADRYGRERLDSLFETERPFYERKVRSLLRWLPPGSRVLELGSFVGAGLDAARAAGWDAVGVDVGVEVTEYARARGLRVLRGELADAEVPPRSLDGVLIWNCLDQIPDPWPVLRRAHALLRPGALLVARVPNGDCFRLSTRLLHARLPEPLLDLIRRAMALNNLLVFPYLYGYTPRHLRALLQASGFDAQRFAGDTLVPLADRHTLPRAAAEEKRLKWAIRALARLAGPATGGTARYAPWIEVFARRRA
ncbi:MAG: class I SAM-dependent methyltransferase [Armatimonadetes bacterium]|nr:class I SAM-dependent methyltransferase [Armatimonadota bacterium]